MESKLIFGKDYFFNQTTEAVGLSVCPYSVIISPFSQRLKWGKEVKDWINPKNYPFWKELIVLLKKENFHIIQVGIKGEEKLNVDEHLFDLKLNELKELINKCDIWISVDNFFNHYGTFCGKKGIVLWGKSDPEIFGYDENINLLKDRSRLRPRQFEVWEQTFFDKDDFVHPEVIINHIRKEKEKWKLNR